MKKLLFAAYNREHLENFVELEKFLQDKFEIYYLDVNDIVKQRIDFTGKKTVKFDVDYPFPESFFLLSSLQKLKFAFKNRKRMANLAKGYDAFVIGSDSLFNRILLNSARRKNKKTFLLLDSIVYDAYKYRYSKDANNKVLRHKFFKQLLNVGPLNEIFPVLIGSTKVNAIFVSGNYSKESVEKYNKNSLVYATGIPRFSKFQILKSDEALKPSDVINIAYFTGAYQWHKNYKSIDAQEKNIAALVKLIEDLRKETGKDVRFIIKIHPRDDAKYYEQYKDRNFIDIIEGGNNLELYKRLDCLLAISCTTMIESLRIVNKVGAMVLYTDQDDIKQNEYLNSGMFLLIKSEEELRAEILDLLSSNDQFDENRLQTVNRFVSESTIDSAKIISEIIETIVFNKT
ncbi:hypothetical protein [Aquimarina celericrescens]|uniref:CDP-glycerol--glycerophosphate glycerophosphotransferase n=1 Tax=Aquimarina celericrescens TaxID=1964542 RepID=A0ABW5AWH1_9FLAO|nr:hypothetical protein [Aquimarina celericrescens]